MLIKANMLTATLHHRCLLFLLLACYVPKVAKEEYMRSV